MGGARRRYPPGVQAMSKHKWELRSEAGKHGGTLWILYRDGRPVVVGGDEASMRQSLKFFEEEF